MDKYNKQSGYKGNKAPIDKNSRRELDRPYKSKSYDAKKPPHDGQGYSDSRKKPYKSRDTYGEAAKFSHAERSVSSDIDADNKENELDDGVVIGRNAVRELLKSDRTVDKLLVRKGDREGSIVMLVAEAIEKGIPIVEVDKARLDAIAGFAPHQGVVAYAAQKEYCDVDDILKIAEERGEAPLIVISDGICDPYNLGSLIRCAEGCGAHGLIIPKRRSAGLSSLVSKASAGAIEHLAIAKVSNIAQTVTSLQKSGVWVYAAEAGGNAHYDTDLRGACALVFGSEGDGVSEIVKNKCDGIISIPMYGKVNSFNVSTAAAVILAEAAKQHRK